MSKLADIPLRTRRPKIDPAAEEAFMKGIRARGQGELPESEPPKPAVQREVSLSMTDANVTSVVPEGMTLVRASRATRRKSASNADRARLNLTIATDLRQRLKLACAQHDASQSYIIEYVLSRGLDALETDGLPDPDAL